MIKKLLILILPFFLYAGGTYSLQLGTFFKKDSAEKFLKKNQKRIREKELFLYKTDRGLWTVRYFVSNNYRDVLREKKIFPIKSVIVPTDIKKVKMQKKEKAMILEISRVDSKKEKAMILEMQKFNSQIVDSYTVFVEIRDMLYTVQYIQNNNPLSEKFFKDTLIDKRFLNSLTLIKDSSKIVVQLEEQNLERFKERILEILEHNEKVENLRIRWRRVIR
ncbi:hypothetical protein ThvES_00003670 [Thiovulum sp. ES]|nr:hypothetical protein ThvES_00003670 [Thiovulum sp. ES]